MLYNRFDKHGLKTVLNEQTVRSTRLYNPVWQLAVLHDTPVCQTGCLYTQYKHFDNRFDNGFDNRLYRVNRASVILGYL